jgi:hypothetical protein
MVTIFAVCKVLKMEGATVTAAEVAMAVPSMPVQVSVYVAVPGAVGATTTVPLAGWVPLKAPAVALEAEAVHEVASVDDHETATPWPKLMVVGCAGDVIFTVGIADMSDGMLDAMLEGMVDMGGMEL